MLQVVITGIYLFDLFLILQIVNVGLSHFLSALIKTHTPGSHYVQSTIRRNITGYKN
jgi:hypothetical protein